MHLSTEETNVRVELDQQGSLRRSHRAGDLRVENVGTHVTIMGWVEAKRDHGGLIFVDLRDRSGLVQVVFDPDRSPELHSRARQLRPEYVIAVRGEVTPRAPELINPNLPSGEVEVIPDELRVLNWAKTPPLAVRGELHAEEALRLKYRYLDLRREEMQENIIIRHRIVKAVRDFFDEEGFIEIETPMLTRSTPEGARDYLVPSRIHPGDFYALPQSPQLYKQLLMVAGFEKYVQIVRCFRDEDLRADRQPEFTQVDVELSFATEEEVYELTEQMMAHVFDRVLGEKLPLPFPRLTYAEALNRYGTDKPDLRYGLELHDVSPVVADSKFRVFSATVQGGGVVKGFALPDGSDLSRRELDELEELAKSRGAKGLAWIALGTTGELGLEDVRSPIAKFLSTDELQGIARECEAAAGDLLLLIAADPATANRTLGALRTHVASRYDLIPDDADWRFLWVTEFPLLEWSPQEERYAAMHHPFTAPLPDDLERLSSDPTVVRARAYDVVLNGTELGGGSIRIHQRAIQERVFDALDMEAREQQEKFGFLLEAFEYGTPPHGGIALGLDRMVMLLAGASTIRDVMAFPKTTSASSLMIRAPSPVDEKQLRELHIKVVNDGEGDR